MDLLKILVAKKLEIDSLRCSLCITWKQNDSLRSKIFKSLKIGNICEVNVELTRIKYEIDLETTYREKEMLIKY